MIASFPKRRATHRFSDPFPIQHFLVARFEIGHAQRKNRPLPAATSRVIACRAVAQNLKKGRKTPTSHSHAGLLYLKPFQNASLFFTFFEKIFCPKTASFRALRHHTTSAARLFPLPQDVSLYIYTLLYIVLLFFFDKKVVYSLQFSERDKSGETKTNGARGIREGRAPPLRRPLSLLTFYFFPFTCSLPARRIRDDVGIVPYGRRT